MRITRTVQSSKSVAEAFAFLSDFTTTTQWDPGTVSTTKISGNGGVGTLYANTTQFNGRETNLQYEVIEYAQDSLVRLRGENKTLTAIDTMTFTATESGCEVTYDANFTFKGIYKLVEPFLKKAFAKLGDEAEAGLVAALN